MKSKRIITLLPVVGLAWLAACAGDPNRLPESEVEWQSSPLSSPAGTTYIPNGRIEVCFTPARIVTNPDGTETRIIIDPINNPSPWDAQAAAFMVLAQNTIESSYENVPGAVIDFTGWGLCSNHITGSLPGKLRLAFRVNGTLGPWSSTHCTLTDHIGFDATACSEAGIGYSASKENFIGMSAGYYGSNDPGAVLHEVGHAMGFRHEMERSDSLDTYQLSTFSCVPRTGGSSIGGMTFYDGISIMNTTYCHSLSNLSPLDRLGVAITYATSFTEAPSIDTSFMLGDGSYVAMPYSRVTQIWLKDGATSAAFQNLPSWGMDSTYPGGTSFYLPASGLHSVAGSYGDFRGRWHNVRTTTVDVNPSRFAAIASAVL